MVCVIMTSLVLVLLYVAGSRVLGGNIEISNGGVCFHGKVADEMLKHYIKTHYGEQSLNCCKGINRPNDCGDIDKTNGNGVYKILPDGSTKPFDVYCNMDIDGGGWTVFQRRLSGETDFFRNWTEYEKGFGNVEKEFWLGNENLHTLTSKGKYELRIDLEDFENNKRYAKYSTFSVGNAASKYKITIGGYSGNAGDAMSYNDGSAFSTTDNVNDIWGKNCATEYKGAWWYKECHYANLNGAYLKGEHKSYADGIEWHQWRGYYYSLKSTSMMIRKLAN